MEHQQNIKFYSIYRYKILKKADKSTASKLVKKINEEVIILFEQFYCPSSTTIAKWIRAYEIRLKLPKFYESNRFGWHNIKFTLNFNESNMVQKMQFYSLSRYQLNESIEQIHFELTKLFGKNSPSISILKEWINCYYLEYANQPQVKEKINEMEILNSRIYNETNFTSEDFNPIVKDEKNLNQTVNSQPINLNADTMIINNENRRFFIKEEDFNPIVKDEKNLNQTVNSQPINLNADTMIINNENRRFFIKEEDFNPIVKDEKNLNQTVNSQPINLNADTMIINNENRRFFIKEEDFNPIVKDEKNLNQTVNSQPINLNADTIIINNENRRFFIKEEDFNPIVKDEKNLNQTVNSQPINLNADTMIINNENRRFFIKEEDFNPIVDEDEKDEKKLNQTPLVESEEISQSKQIKHPTEFKREPFITINENLKENETIDKLIEDIVRNKLKRKLKKKSKLINSHLYDAFQIIEKLQSQIQTLKENEINLLKKNEELKSFINKFEKYEPLCLPIKRVNINI
jgi:hypothetical protein